MKIGHFQNSISDEPILTALKQGSLAIQGEFQWGSNYTFLAKVQHGALTLQAVYKPTRGERPLWDFPPASLARREAAAYLVSEALGWRLVPPTVYRRRGTLGPGSLQLFIEHNPEYHYFTFSEEDHQRLRPTALFDVLINNADRKGSHILIDKDNHIWLIDHGICFHEEDKLRTVVWDFAGGSLPPELRNDLIHFVEELAAETTLFNDLKTYLSLVELRAMKERAEILAAEGHFPNPNPSRRSQPWPPI
jgi:uncharacterized repeat protein (TIGR03843 family)